jgi:predicted MFS family arabinose efflux permease
MQSTAQNWLVLEISGDPFYLGLDAFLGQIPIFLLSLVGGVIADRYDRRLLLIGSQVIQLICAFTLAALFALQSAQIWHILSLSFVVGIAQAFGGPAYQALVPSLVAKEDLSNAIALNSIQFNLARVIGPVLGGLALNKLGASWCFSLNGVSFLAVILSLLLVKPNFVPSGKPNGSIREGIMEGLRFVKGQAALPSLIVIAFGMTALSIPLLVFLPVVVKDVLGKSSDVFSTMLAVSGVGSICGALLVATLSQMKRKGYIALLTLIALGVTIVGFSFSRNLILTGCLVFAGGAALIMAFALISSLVQTVAPDDMRGRVMSVYNVAFRGGMPFGSFASGSLIHYLTAPPVLALNGAALAVLGAYFLFTRRKVAQL